MAYCEMDREFCGHGLAERRKAATVVAGELLISPNGVAHFPGCPHKGDDPDYSRWVKLDSRVPGNERWCALVFCLVIVPDQRLRNCAAVHGMGKVSGPTPLLMTPPHRKRAFSLTRHRRKQGGLLRAVIPAVVHEGFIYAPGRFFLRLPPCVVLP
jgi:hypothetical protein